MQNQIAQLSGLDLIHLNLAKHGPHHFDQGKATEMQHYQGVCTFRIGQDCYRQRLKISDIFQHHFHITAVTLFRGLIIQCAEQLTFMLKEI
jgi:hypothetical protein